MRQKAIYVFSAIGLSIILDTLKFVNFVHGVLYLVSTYAGLFVVLSMPLSSGKLAEWGFSSFGLDIGFLAALLFVPFFVFGVGPLMERYLARTLYDYPDTDQILVTFDLAIVVQELFRILLDSSSLPFKQPEQVLSVGSFAGIPVSSPTTLPIVGNFPQWRLWVIGIIAVLVALVYLLAEYIGFGLAVRAGTRDAEMVRLLSIKITRSHIVVFGIGVALAGVAGVVGGPLDVVNPTIGMNILVPAFLMVIIDGIGSITGAVAGSIVFSLTTAVLVSFAPVWLQVGLCATAAVVLLTRPQGLLSDEEMAP